MASISRRAAFAAPAALIAMGAPSAAPAVTVRATIASPDACLIDLCRRYMSLERRQNMLFDAESEAQQAGDKERAERLAWIQERFTSAQTELADRIHGHRSYTASGVRAKAEVAMTYVCHDLEGAPLHSDIVLWSLCQDLLRD